MSYFVLVGRLASSIKARAQLPPLSKGARRIIGWAAWDEIEALVFDDKIRRIGGRGGVIEKGDRWADYLAIMEEETWPYLEAFRAEVIAHNLKRGGDWHQNDAQGAAVFDDGAVAMFSFRAWGDALAAIWAEAENVDYQYMDFYMDALVEDRAAPE